jgi:hypothetical protein
VVFRIGIFQPLGEDVLVECDALCRYRQTVRLPIPRVGLFSYCVNGLTNFKTGWSIVHFQNKELSQEILHEKDGIVHTCEVEAGYREAGVGG